MGKPFTYIVDLGKTENGIINRIDRPKWEDSGKKLPMRAFSDETPPLKSKGQEIGRCYGGVGHRDPDASHTSPERRNGELLINKRKCHTRSKNAKGINYYRYDTLKPNSRLTGLFGATQRKAGLPYDKAQDGSIVNGQPCPEASSAKWAGPQTAGGIKAYVGSGNESRSNKLECTYKDIDATMLIKMSNAMKADERSGPRYNTWMAVANEYCIDPRNAHTVISKNDFKCKQIFTNKNQTQEFCKVEDNIAKNTTLCSPENIGDQAMYDKLGTDFCRANPTHAWCGCYNVISKTCATNKNASGCLGVAEYFKEMEASGMNTAVFRQKPQCTAPACNKPQGEVWKPVVDKTTMQCDSKINICTQAITQGVGEGSPITASCDFNDTQINEAARNGSRDPSKARALAANADRAAAARAAAGRDDSGGPRAALKGGYTAYIIGFIVMLCMCAAIAGVALM